MSTTGSAPANLFPGARADAPDLVDEARPDAGARPGFPAAPAASAFSHATAAPLTKVGRACGFLHERGKATAQELCELLGCERRGLRALLLSAIKDGRIVANGDEFTAGTQCVEKTPKAVQMKKESAPRSPRISGPDATVHASLCVHDLQIIAWAAGNLTIRANDNVVDLDSAQLLALHAFLELAR
jgi:hypothetical protein